MPTHDLVGVDSETKPVRAVRAVQRPVQSNEPQRVGETLDLFAEDAERANQQAMNTDIRQGTFEGFELPEVFMAAVQSKHGSPGEAKRPAPASAAPSLPLNTIDPAPLFAADDRQNPEPSMPDLPPHG